jgi:hypothetical protein
MVVAAALAVSAALLQLPAPGGRTATPSPAALVDPRDATSSPAAHDVVPSPAAVHPQSPAPRTTPPPESAAPGPTSSARPAAVAREPDCERRFEGRRRARELLAGRLIIPPFEAVPMPTDPTWSENPFHDRHWEFSYHSLRIIWDLIEEWEASSDPLARQRILSLLADWVRDNPPGSRRSVFSWNDHATALRTLVIACVLQHFPEEAWVRHALATHGRILADPRFYVAHGNHALNQNRGLLAAGCVLGRETWRDLAIRRLATLVQESVDEQGVTNEQAVFYQLYNYRAYRRAVDRIERCRLAVPPPLERIKRMPDFLAHAILPDGTFTLIGDTVRRHAERIPGTTAEFAFTQGAAGTRPDTTYARYDAGFVFSRTGWGDVRRFEREVAMSLRFGPPRRWHGHDDGGSLTLYGYGRRLLEDPGIFTYNYDEWHAFALSRRAHNVVTVAGLRYDSGVPTRLVRATTSATHDDTIVSNRGYPGVDYVRRVIFSHSAGYLAVEDRLSATRARRFEQLWHLDAGLEPVVDGTTVRSAGGAGSVTIIQLGARPTVEIVTGQRRPVQGWLSFRVGHRTAAPVVVAATTGRDVRYLSLVVPTASADDVVSVEDVSVTKTGWSLIVEVAGTRERLVVTANASSVEPAP